MRSIESIRSWHSECVLNHPRCRKTLSGTQDCVIDKAPLPTRCIETLPIILEDGTSSWRYVLRETATQAGQSVILSHRWDEDTKKSKTTNANVDERLGKCQQVTHHAQPCTWGIDWMPRLFIETCDLAHKLGIKYVWIGSLCIVQPENDGEDGKDDREDWKREAPMMAQYYQNAWITVFAASEALDGGLFNMRRTKRISRIIRLPYGNRDGEAKGYFYIQRARPDVLQDEFTRDIEESDLRHRGWVYQEWTLSRRIIAFLGSGFFLHCHSFGTKSPTGDELSEPSPESSGESHMGNLYLETYGRRWPLVIADRWQTIVSEYSSLALSKLVEDRLMALAGIASEVSKRVEVLERKEPTSCFMEHENSLFTRYACGIWLRDICGLLWEQATPGLRRRVPGIPTWSWASMASRFTVVEGRETLTGGLGVRWPIPQKGDFKPV